MSHKKMSRSIVIYSTESHQAMWDFRLVQISCQESRYLFCSYIHVLKTAHNRRCLENYLSHLDSVDLWIELLDSDLATSCTYFTAWFLSCSLSKCFLYFRISAIAAYVTGLLMWCLVAEMQRIEKNILGCGRFVTSYWLRS